MPKHYQKSENSGGRFDGSSKILGSIKFEANIQPTVIAVQNEWYSIGTGAIGHILFETTLTTEYAPYFILSGTAITNQVLTLKKGKKPTFLNVHFGMAARIAGGGTPSNVELRVRRTDIDNITSTVAQTFGSISATGFDFSFQFTQPVALVKDDRIFMEIRNTTAAQNIIVTAANLSFSQ